MKVCKKCNETKPLTEFHKDKSAKDGRHAYCKACKRISAKQWYQENKEAIAEHHRQYRQKNKEAISEHNRQYRQKNKEAVLEYQRQYYQENKEAIAKRERQYYQKNKEAISEYKRQYRQKNKEAITEHQRQWYQENKKAFLERGRQYRQERKAKQPGCVYQIVNSINGKVYVGQTTSGNLRWKKHLSALRGNYHENPNLQADFNKFGEEAFEWSIIQELSKDKEMLEQEETKIIQKFLSEGKNLYNVQKTSEDK